MVRRASILGSEGDNPKLYHVKILPLDDILRMVRARPMKMEIYHRYIISISGFMGSFMVYVYRFACLRWLEKIESIPQMGG